jgi:hypothetical protein
VIGTENFAPDAVVQSSENQAPAWQPQLLIVTVTVLSLRCECAKVISSPNSLSEVASKPMLGRLPGSGYTLLRQIVCPAELASAAGAASTSLAAAAATAQWSLCILAHVLAVRKRTPMPAVDVIVD